MTFTITHIPGNAKQPALPSIQTDSRRKVMQEAEGGSCNYYGAFVVKAGRKTVAVFCNGDLFKSLPAARKSDRFAPR